MPPPLVRTHWPLVLVSVACGVLAAMQVGKVPLALPAIRDEFSLGLASGGFVASLLNLVSALFGFAAGLSADRMGHRRAILIGLLVLAAGSVGGGLASTVGWLYAARFAEGAGFMMIIVSAPALIARATTPEHRRIALGAWGTYMPAGMAIILIGAPFVLQSIGWRGLWLVSGGVLVGFALLFRIATRNAPPPLPPRRLKDALPVLKSPGAWLLAVTFTCYTVQWTGLMTWLPTILFDDMNLSPPTVALLTAGAVAISVFGNLISGWVLQKGAPHALMLLMGHVGMGSGAWALFQTDLDTTVRLVAVFSFSFLGGAVPSSMFSSVLHHVPSPSLAGTANGMLVQGNNIGSFTGAPLLGALAAGAASWTIIGAALPALAGVAGLCAIAIAWLERHPE